MLTAGYGTLSRESRTTLALYSFRAGSDRGKVMTCPFYCSSHGEVGANGVQRIRATAILVLPKSLRYT